MSNQAAKIIEILERNMNFHSEAGRSIQASTLSAALADIRQENFQKEPSEEVEQIIVIIKRTLNHHRQVGDHPLRTPSLALTGVLADIDREVLNKGRDKNIIGEMRQLLSGMSAEHGIPTEEVMNIIKRQEKNFVGL